MTPSQTQALQEVREQIIKKHLKTEDQEKGINVFFAYNGAMEEYAKLYHTRLLAEAGRELPDDTKAKKHWNDNLRMGNCTHSEAFFDAYDWMHEKASTLLAAKQGEIERLKEAAMELFNMVHDSDLIHNKIKANELYHTINPSTKI